MFVLLRVVFFCALFDVALAKPFVVSTTTIVADLVRVTAGDRVDHRCLLPAGADPHAYEPSPADVRLLAKADLLVVNGLGFETWLDKLVKNSGFRGRIATASEGITPLETDESPGAVHNSHAHDHEHEEKDPHAWHDLKNVGRYVENIRAALAEIDAPNADVYATRATAYFNELRALDTFARDQLAAIPAANRKLVTSHDALGYLGHAYNLQIAPISGLRPDREPTARELAAIVKFIRQQNVRAIFVESTSNPKIPELLAREAGVSVVSELYTDSLGAADSPGATFLGMFRSNIETIARALR